MMNLANTLTIGRLLLLPFIIWLFFLPGANAAWWCFALYVIGAITDFLDGWVARKFNQVSEFGKFLDPISDKIFVAVILLMLVAIGRVTDYWVIAIMVIFTREFLVSGLREFLGPKNVKLPVTNLAKWKTTVQMIATGALIIAPYIPFGFEIGLYGLAIAALLTVMTGWGYLAAAKEHFK
jgi:cardiolipin synthase